MEQVSTSSNPLFPTKASFLIFWSYITLFVSQGILVTAVQRSHIHGFDATIVVLLTELVKLIICIVIYLIRSQGNFLQLFNDIHKNHRLLLLYLVPSFLYCLYNNLTFINLELFDLTTYYCLMQFRIVLTAVIYQVLFRRQLTIVQWTSLIILTFGCLVKEYGLYNSISNKQTNTTQIINATSLPHLEQVTSIKENEESVNPVIKFAWLTLLLLLQMFCSCFAGVYNEFLLKDLSTANNADVILQNIFMYIDSILCNVVVFKIAKNSNSNKPNEAVSVTTILYNLLTHPLVIILIFNNAFSGLVASFFLKSLNSILKTFASALELFAVAFLAWILFNDKVDVHTIVALLLVTAATFLYSRNPVSVAPPSRATPRRDGFVLVPTSED